MAEAEAENKQPWPRVVIGLLPERNGVPTAGILFDFIAIAMLGHPFIRTEYSRTDLQRNKLAEHLLTTDFTHILMLDADHRHPQRIVERLSRWVKQDPGRLVVAGLAFRRCEPYDPNVFLLDEEHGDVLQPVEWDKGLLKVDIAGTAAMLIAREVFERIEKPWFAMDYSGAAEGRWPGEDIWFCKQCKQAGIEIYVDTTTISPHLTEAWIDQGTYETFRAMREKAALGELPTREEELRGVGSRE